MKVAILGLGKIGHNMAALMASRGFEVCGFTRNDEKARAVNEYGITVHGALDGNFKVAATTDIAQAVKDARFLIVTTTSKGHKPIAQLLRGHLEAGQGIVIMTGNWGAYEMYSVLRDEVREKKIVIGETSGNLAASPSLTYPATTFMKPSKKSMSFATIPASAAPAMVEALKKLFPEFYPVRNVLDTSMNNTNPPVHVPLCIFNITRMANGEEASFYGECLPQILLDFTVAADAERCAVVKAVGGTPATILELMNTAWKVNYGNIKDLGLNNASLSKVKLPNTPYHRFLLEDVPYGYLPISRLGKKFGVPTPRIDLLINAYKYLLANKAQMDGPEFNIDFQEIL